MPKRKNPEMSAQGPVVIFLKGGANPVIDETLSIITDAGGRRIDITSCRCRIAWSANNDRGLMVWVEVDGDERSPFTIPRGQIEKITKSGIQVWPKLAKS